MKTRLLYLAMLTCATISSLRPSVTITNSEPNAQKLAITVGGYTKWEVSPRQSITIPEADNKLIGVHVFTDPQTKCEFDATWTTSGQSLSVRYAPATDRRAALLVCNDPNAIPYN